MRLAVLSPVTGERDLREMFGTNPAIEKVLKRKESRKITPTKGKHKKNVKEAPSEEYKPGEY